MRAPTSSGVTALNSCPTRDEMRGPTTVAANDLRPHDGTDHATSVAANGSTNAASMVATETGLATETAVTDDVMIVARSNAG